MLAFGKIPMGKTAGTTQPGHLVPRFPNSPRGCKDSVATEVAGSLRTLQRGHSSASVWPISR